MNEKLIYEILASATVSIVEFEEQIDKMIKDLNDISKDN